MCQIVDDQKLHLLSVIVCALTKHPDGALYIVCTVFADRWIGGKWSQTFFSRKPLGRPSWWCQRQGPDKKALQLLQKFFNWERGVEKGEGGGGGRGRGEIQSSTIQEILWKCQKRWPGNFILIYDAQTLLLRFIYFEDLKQKKWWSLLHRRPSHQH